MRFCRGTSKTPVVNYSIEHLGLPAREPIALKDWYSKAFDARVVFENGQTPPTFLLSMPGGAMIEIYPGDLAMAETSNNKLNGWRHLALRVDSIEAARADLESRGVEFHDEIKPAAGGGRILFFKDPEANLLHLVERQK